MTISINGTPGDDILSGTPGDDIILGDLGNDRIDGGAGNDFLAGDPGDDIIDGGAGIDTAEFLDYVNSGTVNINLMTGTATGPSGNDTLISIEHVMAFGYLNTTIIGSNGDDILEAFGNAINTVSGGAGDDL